MKTTLLTLITVFIISNTLYSQCDFYEDYSTNLGWTQVGTDVEIVDGKLKYINGSADGNGSNGPQRRVYKSLGVTLDSNDVWHAEFEFTPNTVGVNGSDPWVGHSLLGMTAGTQEPLWNCPDLTCTGYPTPVDDAIIIAYQTTNPADGNMFFWLRARESGTLYTSDKIIANTLNITYYHRLERTSPTNFRLSVFSDSARTVHLAGSPVNFTTPNTLHGFNTVQHGNLVGYDYRRELTGSIDNLCINFNPTPPPCDFYDDYSTTSGWTQVGSDVEIIGGKLEYINGAADGNGSNGPQRRVYKSLGATLDSNDVWHAEFEFTPNIVGINGSDPWVGHSLLGMTAGTQEPLWNCPDLPCTGYPTPIDDAIIIAYQTTNPADGNMFFWLRARESGILYISDKIIANTLNITYYHRLERTSPTNFRLSVFSDLARTVHLAGSPINFTTPNTLHGFNTVQHGNLVGYDYRRELTGSIDNLCIKFDEISGIDDSMVKKKGINLFPNPNSGQFMINLENMKGNSLIEIYNLLGEKLYTKTTNSSSFSVNFYDKSQGFYLIRVINNEDVITRTFVKK